MRKPQSVIINRTCHPSSAQQGFSLFIVLMVMIVVAFFVVSVTQSYNTEQRISTNDADHKYAFAQAEAALLEGEARIAGDDFQNPQEFTRDCDNNGNGKVGLCSATGARKETFGGNKQVKADVPATEKEAWQRLCGTDLCIDTNGSIDTNGTKAPSGNKKPRHIIEYVSTQDDGRIIYRVTAKAWGENKNTVAVVQSYVSAD